MPCSVALQHFETIKSPKILEDTLVSNSFVFFFSSLLVSDPHILLQRRIPPIVLAHPPDAADVAPALVRELVLLSDPFDIQVLTSLLEALFVCFALCSCLT